MPKKPGENQPIDAELDEAVDSLAQVAGPKSKNIKGLNPRAAPQVATPRQLPLDLGIEVERDVGGVEMGVLQNGIPYLTQRGLAKISGAARNSIQEISKEWEGSFNESVIPRGRLSFLRENLLNVGYDQPSLYIEILKDGSPHYTYPDVVCMAIVEYYAFEAQKTNDTALKNFRRFARYGLQKFIYDALGYIPEDKWRHFQERVSLLKDSAPIGYFIIFNEIASMVVDLINAGLTINEKTVPDISVGMAWGAFWAENKLDSRIGARVRFGHNYPSFFPQSRRNPQPSWAYPDKALPLFRRWFRSTYLPTKFPNYILKKAKLLPGGRLEAERIAALYDEKILASRDEDDG